MCEAHEEAIAAVEHLNDRMYDKIQDAYPHFELRSLGREIEIYFAGLRVWDSESDTREYDDIKDDFEPMLDYLKREALKYLGLLNSVAYVLDPFVKNTDIAPRYPVYGETVVGVSSDGEEMWRHGDLGWYREAEWGNGHEYPHTYVTAWRYPRPSEK